MPFLALGLGMNDMFLIAHQYAQSSKSDLTEKVLFLMYILMTVGIKQMSLIILLGIIHKGV